MNPVQWSFALLCAVSIVHPALAESGRDVMKRVSEQGKIHRDQRYDVHMQIFDSQGRERERYFTSRKKYVGNENYGIARFYQPANLKGTALLSESSEGDSATNQWIYLPAFRAVKKLSSDDRNNSFMGSDFSNADMGGRNVDEDRHQLKASDEKYYHVESVPISRDDAYGKISYKILRKAMIPVTVAFYDRSGQLLKKLRNRRIKKHKGMYVVVEAVMQNVRTGGKTRLSISEIDTDSSKPVEYYSPNRLRQ